MINGEKIIGTSLFSFAEGMDNGDIWVQESIEVSKNDYISEVLERLQNKMLNIFEKNYLDLLEGSLSPQKQDNDNAIYCSQRYPEAGCIDWHKPAKEIYDFIRAQSEPYPGAFTYYKSKKVIIWSSHLYDPVYYGTPGQIAQLTSEGPFIICGDNKAILINKIEVDGKKKYANDFFKSIKIKLSSEI